MPEISSSGRSGSRRSVRSFRWLALFALAASACTTMATQGCVAQSEESDLPDAPFENIAEAHAAVELRERFPAVAEAILDGPDLFQVTQKGFVLPPQRNGFVRVGITLPSDTQSGFVVETPDGFQIRVHEEGASGTPFRAARAVGFQRAGGTSFWTVAANGIEEWLLLDEGVVRDDEPAAVWHVEGGTLVNRGDAVGIADENGKMRAYVVAPKAYAKGGREVTVRLATQGNELRAFVEGAQGEEVLVDPGWSVVAPMLAKRHYHTMVTLQDGRVLAVGGFDSTAGSNGFATSELYNPAMNTWTAGPSMSNTRILINAVRLQDGRVLVAGGSLNNTPNATATAEIYNPVTNTWSATGTLSAARYGYGAALLPNGKVLLASGYTGSYVVSAELYDPATGTWSNAGNVSVGRFLPAAVLLGNGKVLLAAGYASSGSHNVVNLYDPATNTWSTAASTNQFHSIPAAALLPSGQALVVGDATAELYNASTNTWTNAGALVANRNSTMGLMVLPGGNAVVGGGTPVATAEKFTYGSLSWAADGALGTARAYVASAEISPGMLLVAGGQAAAGSTNAVDLYAAGTNNGTACAQAVDCVSGFCVDGVCCNSACGGGAANDCQACSVAAGAMVNGTCSPLTATACNDGNACTQMDTCQAGTCTGANPVVCMAMDQCHDVGVCNPATGACSNPAKVDGTTCNDGNACTQMDSCQAGACSGANPVVCMAMDQCHDAGICDPATGACSNPAKADGSACNDGNACTQLDTCQAGACNGANPVVCVASDQCHDPGICDPATGVCSNPAEPDGSACNDGNACTQTDTCQAGACTGGNPVVCVASDQCHDPGICDPATGVCSDPAEPDGSACNDGNACTQTDTCQAGACTGGIPVTCKASDECNTASCDPAAGCAEQVAPDGTPCTGGECNAGECTPKGTGGAGGGTGGAGVGGMGGTGGGGMGGSGAEGGGTGGSGGARPSPSPDAGGGCDCQSAGGSSGSSAGGALLVGLLGLVFERRRRTRRSA